MTKEEKRVVPANDGFKKMVERAGSTEAGRDLLAWLAVRCHQFRSNLMRLHNGDVSSLSTECREAQRAIWLELRQQMPVEMRHSIEAQAETVLVVKPQEEERKK